MRQRTDDALRRAHALTACGKASVQDVADRISGELQGSQKIVMTAKISANYGDKVYNFKISCSKTPEETRIDIKEPKTLAGISAVCVEVGYELSFDGVQVTTGVLTRNGLSPAEALPALISQWQDGYITGAVFEKYGGVSAAALDTCFTDDIMQRTWFDTENLLPIHSDISQNGTVVISCDFENIIIE